jgi:hypothetical protein
MDDGDAPAHRIAIASPFGRQLPVHLEAVHAALSRQWKRLFVPAPEHDLTNVTYDVGWDLCGGEITANPYLEEAERSEPKNGRHHRIYKREREGEMLSSSEDLPRR